MLHASSCPLPFCYTINNCLLNITVSVFSIYVVVSGCALYQFLWMWKPTNSPLPRKQVKSDLVFNAGWNMNVSLSTSPTWYGENAMLVACIPGCTMASFLSYVFIHIGFSLHTNRNNIFHDVIPMESVLLVTWHKKQVKPSGTLTISFTRWSMATSLSLRWRLFPWCSMASISIIFHVIVCKTVTTTMGLLFYVTTGAK